MGTANAVYTGAVQVTCTNGTFGTGWDNDNPYFADKGNIAAHYCDIIQHSGYVSDNLTNDQLRWYQGVVIQDTPTATVETHTPQVPPSQETLTAPSLPQETETPVNAPETDTSPVVVDTPTSISDSLTASPETTPVIVLPDETQTVTSESSTQTIPSETSTLPIETPLPTPPPVVEPQPVPQPVAVAPQPEPQPQPEPEPLPPVIDEEVPSEESVPSDEPVSEEQVPVEEPSEYPEEEDTNEIPVDDVIQEQPEPTPVLEPEPVSEPEPASPIDVSPVTPIVSEPMVTLANGVVITEEEAAAVVLLSNPAELLSELFSDPGAVFSALGSVGADMSPEVREKSEKIVLSAVIAGNIATQAAATAGAVAAYRRKP